MPSVLDPPDVNIWDRQRDEPPNAWFAFRLWRDRRPHPTYVALADELDADPQTVGRWAKDWSWKVRLVEYERSVDATVQAAVVAHDTSSVETMRQVHLGDASRLRQAALGQLGRLEESRPSLQAATRALDIATRLERLTHGQATDITERADYSKLSDAELEALGALLDKAEGKS